VKGSMEIQTLRVLVREEEINQYLPQVVPPDAAVEKLRIRLTPQGVVVQGEYPALFMKVAFETSWETTVSAGQVQARLANVQVAGLPAGLLRGVLLKVIRDVTAQVPGVSVKDESVFLDVGQALLGHQVPVSVYLTAVRLGEGHVVIEAGTPAA
jgi:uncharacterized protein YpmS